MKGSKFPAWHLALQCRTLDWQSGSGSSMTPSKNYLSPFQTRRLCHRCLLLASEHCVTKLDTADVCIDPLMRTFRRSKNICPPHVDDSIHRSTP